MSAVAVCCARASVSSRSFSCRISLVAFSRSRLSARRFSSSRTLEPSFFSDLTLLFAGFARRRIGVPLLFIDDRLGEHAPEGKWAGWVVDDACELNVHGPNAASKTDSWLIPG